MENYQSRKKNILVHGSVGSIGCLPIASGLAIGAFLNASAALAPAQAQEVGSPTQFLLEEVSKGRIGNIFTGKSVKKTQDKVTGFRDANYPPDYSVPARPNSQILVMYSKLEHLLRIYESNPDGSYNPKIYQEYSVPVMGGEGHANPGIPKYVRVGPKTKYLDLHTPVGFYIIRPVDVTQTANFKYAVHLTYPNQWESYKGYKGDGILIHTDEGGSIGCLATPHSQKIRARFELAFRAGQKEIQVHGYDFFPTDENMKKYAPKYPKLVTLWKQQQSIYNDFLKFGYEPRIVVTEEGYALQKTLGRNTVYAQLNSGKPLNTLIAEAKKHGIEKVMLANNKAAPIPRTTPVVEEIQVTQTATVQPVETPNDSTRLTAWPNWQAPQPGALAYAPVSIPTAPAAPSPAGRVQEAFQELCKKGGISVNDPKICAAPDESIFKYEDQLTVFIPGEKTSRVRGRPLVPQQ